MRERYRPSAEDAALKGEYLSDGNHPQYDVARDGRLVMLRAAGVPRAISVVVDWRPDR